MYFLTGSSSLNFPSCCSNTSAAAVNCLATEPDSKIVCGVLGTLCSRSASPNAFSNTISPLSDTAAAQPGPGATYAFVTFSNARSAPATTFSFSGTCALVAVERNAMIVKTNRRCFRVIEFILLMIGEYSSERGGSIYTYLQPQRSTKETNEIGEAGVWWFSQSLL